MEVKVARQIGSSCFVLHVRRAARQISRIYDEALRSAGLNSGQFSLMTMLTALESCSLSRAADGLGLDRTTLNAVLKPLERDGLVRSVKDPADARVRRLALTSAGKARLAEAEPLWRAAQTKIEAKLEGRCADALRSYLHTIALGAEGRSIVPNR